MRTLALVFVLAGALGARVHAQAAATPPAQPPPTTAPSADAAASATATVPPVPAALPLAGPSGMVFHTVKADRTAEFEAVMTRLRDLLAVSVSDVRRQQAAGWRVFRQVAPMADGAILYVSVLDPVVANAEYDVPRLLAEAAPAEAAQLYEQFRDAHVQPTVQASNLSLVVSLAPGAASTTLPGAVKP